MYASFLMIYPFNIIILFAMQDPQLIQRVVERIHPSNKFRNNGVIDAFIIEEDRPRRYLRKKVMDYIDTLKKRAEKTNGSFVQKQLPYRLKIYTQDKKAFIELSTVDGFGNILDKKIRDITKDDFNKLIENISTGIGLIFDS